MFLYMGSICRCIYSSMYFLIYFTILISSWDATSGLARARPGSRISLLARAGPAVTFPCPSAPLASPSNATLPRGPDQPKPVTKLPRKKRFLFPTIFFSLAKQEANNTPRRNKPLRRQRAGDTAEPLLTPPAEAEAEEQGGGRSRGLQEERWGSRSLGEGEASTTCWRGTRARRRA
jgi:hypothetical protein